MVGNESLSICELIVPVVRSVDCILDMTANSITVKYKSQYNQSGEPPILSHSLAPASCRCYSGFMNCHVRKTLLALLLIIVVIMATSFSCATKAPTQRSPEEIALGQQAVREMLWLSVEAASNRQYPVYTVSVLSLYFLPNEATVMLTLVDTIPGAKRLLNEYLMQVVQAAQTVNRSIGPLLQEEIATMEIPDPFALIQGNINAVTAFFISQKGERLNALIIDSLQNLMSTNSTERSAMRSWEELQRLYNTYAVAQNQLSTSNAIKTLPILALNPLAKSAESIRTVFLAQVAAQEDLIRATAASYDSEAIALFMVPERN